jgi:hypothetical protein
LLVDFERHLRALRWSGNPLSLRRANETPLKPIPSLFGPEVLEAVSELYATDFAEFGYSDPMPAGLDPSDEYGEPQIAEVERLIERAERINDLALRGQRLSHALREAQAQARAREAARHRWLKAMRRSALRAKRRVTGGAEPSGKKLPRAADGRSQNGLHAVRKPAPDREERAKQPAR